MRDWSGRKGTSAGFALSDQYNWKELMEVPSSEPVRWWNCMKVNDSMRVGTDGVSARALRPIHRIEQAHRMCQSDRYSVQNFRREIVPFTTLYSAISSSDHTLSIPLPPQNLFLDGILPSSTNTLYTIHSTTYNTFYIIYLDLDVVTQLAVKLQDHI
jgi:hypothetical protein